MSSAALAARSVPDLAQAVAAGDPGIGLAADDEHVAQPARWRGRNLLGSALMKARERLAG